MKALIPGSGSYAFNISVILFAIMACLMISSCGDQESGTRIPALSAADSVEMLYKTEFDSNGVMGVRKVTITDPGEIVRLERTFSQEAFPYIYCISSGSMTFYKGGTVLANVAFNTDKDYRHVAFYNDNKLTALVLTEENAKILDSYSGK